MMTTTDTMTTTEDNILTATARNDAHSPKAINPEEYSFLRCIYLWPIAEDAMMGAKWMEALRAERQAALDLLRLEGFEGNFAHKHTCDHCGARFRYGMLYRHNPSQEIIVVGWICSEKTMTADDRATLEYNRLVDRVHSMRERVKSEAAIAKKKAELFQVYPEMEGLLKVNHRIIKDIADRFNATGFLSPKQMDLVRKLAKEEEDRIANPEASTEPRWVDVVEGRREITAVILSTKLQQSFYGTTMKMLVMEGSREAAQKLWVTMPSDLVIEGTKGSLKGKTVKFSATIERSRDDAKFGFGKNPRGGVVLA